MWWQGGKFHSGWRQSAAGADLAGSVGKSGDGAGKKRRMAFYNFETVRGGKKPQTTSLKVKKESLKDFPFPDFCASEAEFDLEIQVLKIPVLSSKIFAALPPTKDLFFCKLAA